MRKKLLLLNLLDNKPRDAKENRRQSNEQLPAFFIGCKAKERNDNCHRNRNIQEKNQIEHDSNRRKISEQSWIKARKMEKIGEVKEGHSKQSEKFFYI